MEYLKKYHKNIIILIAASLIVASSLVFYISIRQMSETEINDAEQIIQLLCNENAQVMDAHFDNVEETVNTLAYYALKKIKNMDSLKDADARQRFLDEFKMMCVGAAENTDLVVSAFMRLSLEKYSDDAGFYVTIYGDSYRENPITDFSKYDRDDYENVGWYYAPLDSGEPVWMYPYVDKVLKVEMTTYVVPIFYEDEFIGVIGMDMELTRLSSLIKDIRAYKTGYAFLTDANGEPFYEGVDTRNDKAWMTFSQTLVNDMELYVTAPMKEIRASTHKLLKNIIPAVIVILIASVGFSISLAISMNKAVTKTLGEAQRAQREAFEEAQRANQTKSDFLSRMSHDIRTPINGIKGMIEILRRNRYDDARVDDCVDKIDMSAGHLLSLINDVLDMQKLESGKMVFSREAFDIRELIENCITITEPLAKQGNIGIHVDFEGVGHEYLYGSTLHIRQVFLNILSNAVKYNKQDGMVLVKVKELSADEKRAYFTIQFKDTGIGMTDEYIAQAFEPFTQEQSDGRTTYKGTGLGLAIVKKMVEGMGGAIRLESKKNAGSIFEIDLDFEINNEPSSEQQTETVTVSCRGMKVLLVEDNDLNLEIANSLLTDAGIIVSSARNGREAVEAFSGNPAGTYDAILMDVMMPVLSGIEATKEIRAMDREDARKIPIIAVTANAFIEDEKECKEAGMNAHLAKPLDMKKVFEVLSKYVNANKKQEEI